MIWTHIYDLILKLITMFLSIIILLRFPYLAENGILLVLIALVVFAIVYTCFIRTFATYLYCKLTLKMKLSLPQAKGLNNAFSPVFSLGMKWLPMTELKNVDNDVKYQMAIDIYTKWKEENKKNRTRQVQDFKDSGPTTKILTIIMAILAGYFFIAGMMNLPPANYITEVYCRIFDTEKYYPLINALVLILPTILVFKAIDKNIN